MTALYDSIKSMRTAKVGTILPWSGDGGSGFLASNIPKGWIVCTGQTIKAADYPMLASIIGDTYGGDMTDPSGNHYPFPYYGYDDAEFRLPNLSNRVMTDLENTDLNDPTYQYGQSDAQSVVGALINDYGETTPVTTTYEATSDIDFTLNIAGNLYFKFTNISLFAPDFIETLYTLNRKLGINHTPAHGHSDSIGSTNVNPTGPMTFRTDQGIEMTGSASVYCSSDGPNTCALKSAEPTTWQNGATAITFYGDESHEHTLPRMDSFMEFITDSSNKDYWGSVPAGEANWRTNANDRGSGHASTTYTQTIFSRGNTGQLLDTVPVDTHKTPNHTGMFPRPMEYRSRPNYFGYDTGSPVRSDGLVDDPETAPVFSVSGCILDATNKIILPNGTDLRRTYGTAPDTWQQWDKITPLMYVTPVNVDDKYDVLREGTFVQTMEAAQDVSVNPTPQWEITLNSSTLVAGTYDLKFRHGSWPVSMNLGAENKDPIQSSYRAHNHGSFEIQQGIGSMAGPPSHVASNADGSALQAQSLENALNISCDTTQPSITMTFIIKAF